MYTYIVLNILLGREQRTNGFPMKPDLQTQLAV